MKVDEALSDIIEFSKKRMEQLKREVGEVSLDKPLSVSFRPEMRINVVPVEIPDITTGFYQDHLETISAEVLYVNHSAGMVQLEFHKLGEETINKNFANISTNLFAMMFKKAIIDPLA